MTTVSSRTRTHELNRGFTRIFVFSLIVHTVVLGGAVFAQQLKGRRPKVINSIPVQLVKLGRPRDPNLLPQITRPPPPPPDEGIALDTQNNAKPTEQTKEKPKPKDPQLSDAAKRLLEQDSDLDRGRIEEDEGQLDGSKYGTVTEAQNAAAGYLAQVGNVLQQSYKLPATIAESERRFLSAEVILYIEADGTISKYEFQQIHPNEAFKRALELMLQQLKLPPPPKELAETYRVDGLGVRFKPLQ